MKDGLRGLFLNHWRTPSLIWLSAVLFAIAVFSVAGSLIVLGPPPRISLHEAADRGDIAEIRRCAAWGCSLDAWDKFGNPALVSTVCYHSGDYLPVAKALIASGCRVNAVNRDGETALHVAATYINDSSDIVTLLLKAGANVDARDKRARTPLLSAARSGKFQTARLLLDSGADIQAKDAEGHTAMDLAIKAAQERFEGAPEVIELLRSRIGARGKS